MPSQPRRASSRLNRSSHPESHTSGRGCQAPAASSSARNRRTSARSPAARGGSSDAGGTSAGRRVFVNGSVTGPILRHRAGRRPPVPSPLVAQPLRLPHNRRLAWRRPPIVDAAPGREPSVVLAMHMSDGLVNAPTSLLFGGSR